MFWCFHKPHWKLNQLCDCSFSLFSDVCLGSAKLQPLSTIIQDTAVELKEITSSTSLFSDLPICSYQILACLLGYNLVRTSRVILMWDFRTPYTKFKMYLWFKFRWGYELVRTWRTSNSFKNSSYFYSVPPASLFPNSLWICKLWGTESIATYH